VPQLMPGEHPIRVTRQHWTIFIPLGLVGAGALIVGLVLLAITPSTVAGHDIGQVKLLIGLALVLVVGATVLIRYVQWRCLTYMLTDYRIVVRRGVLSRFTESIALDRVQDSGVRQRLLARVLKFGDVEIESAGRDGSEVLHHIADPGGFGNDLLMAIEARRTGQPLPGPAATGGSDHGGYAPPGVTGAPAQPGGYGPAPGYTRGHDGL
jgi:membrane protein YdbS with pleckstrin-like domain